MSEPPLKALDKAIIGDIYRSRTAYERLVELCDSCGPRFAGTAGEQRAATLLAQWLTEAGLAQVHREPFGYLGWRRGESRLEVVQPTAYPLAALALPHCPPGAHRGRALLRWWLARPTTIGPPAPTTGTCRARYYYAPPSQVAPPGSHRPTGA